MSFNSRSDRQGGFTLLEILISIVILSFISIGIYRATTGTFRLRETLSAESDFFNSVRMAMQILGRDVALVYSPALLLPQVNPSARPIAGSTTTLEQLQSGELGRSSEFWNPVLSITGIRPSRFQGTETKMSFIAASHVRVYRESPESELAKITYELVPDKTEDALADSYVLDKTEDSNAFTDDDGAKSETRRTFPLLRGVKKLSFQYYQKDKEKPVKSWDNESTDLKNLYPTVVEVTFEVKGPLNLGYDGIYKFRTEIPFEGIAATF